MRNISAQLADNQSNVSGINRNTSSRGSIRISPPIAPNSDPKLTLRGNPSNSMMNEMEMQPLMQNQSHSPGFSVTNCNALGNQVLSRQYYDQNNYLSHVNNYQQMGKPLNHGLMPSGHPVTTAMATISQSRGSLEDQGVDIGRVSPSGSSNDSRKSRYSSASLDSGRGSDTKISGQSHRVSIHSCESLGSSSSNRDFNRNSSSSSSIGSGNSVGLEGEIDPTPNSDQKRTSVSVGQYISGGLSIPEMVLHGIPDEEIIHSWLSRIHFEEYATNFIRAGYDMPTISRMTPEDLTAIGITKPGKRQILKTEIQKLSIADGIPKFKPDSLLDWLKLLRLEQYFNTLCSQGYDTIDRVTELAWEDLEEVGINKLGHQKKIMLAIKKVKSVNNNLNQSSASVIESPLKLSLPLVPNTAHPCPEVMTRPGNYQMPVMNQFQDTVPIKMFAPTKSSPSPTAESKPITPQLKTFQQLPTNGYMFCRQRSDGSYYGFLPNDAQQTAVFNSSRGRSLESLDNTESNYYQMYCGKQQLQRQVINGFQRPITFSENENTYGMRDNDQVHGYETDSEVFNSYANARKCFYEIDGTATLQRPKGLIKNKPIAKIIAKTRQTDSNEQLNQQMLNEPMKTCFDNRLDSMTQTDNTPQSPYICDDGQTSTYFQDMSSQIYSSLKRKKPPPPPKRVNSIRNSPSGSPIYGAPPLPTFGSAQHSAHRDGYEGFQEEVFASCVKSLTSRFSMNDNEVERHSSDYNDFPPPPSPLSFSECNNFNTLQRRPDRNDRSDSNERDCNISSSSSTESMPFANDNIGTILRVNNDSMHKSLASPSSSTICSAPPSMTCSPSSALPPTSSHSRDFANRNLDSNSLAKCLSPTKPSNERLSTFRVDPRDKAAVSSGPIDQLDDIETMLVNLSEQLDLMLENDKHRHRNN